MKATIDKIHECGVKAGISICPETPTEVLEEYLTEVDMILVMTVHPGFGGQKLIPETIDKVRKLRTMLKDRKLDTDIQVDGGIYTANVRDVIEAGANVIVAGSAVFKDSPGKNTRDFMEILKCYE